MGKIYQCLKVLWVSNIHDSIFFNIKGSLPGSPNWNSDLNQVADKISQISFYFFFATWTLLPACLWISLQMPVSLELLTTSMTHSWMWFTSITAITDMAFQEVFAIKLFRAGRTLVQFGCSTFCFLCLLRLDLCLNVFLQESQTNSLSCSADEPSCTLSSCSLSLQLSLSMAFTGNLYNLVFI